MPTQNIKLVCNKSYNSFSEARIKSFSKAPTLIDISTVLKETNSNATYQVFENLFMAKLKNFFPLQKSNKNKSSKSWFDSELQKLLDKEKLIRWCIHQKTFLRKNAFNEARNIYFRAIKDKKTSIFQKI